MIHVAIQSTKGDDIKTMKIDIAIVLLQVLDLECLPNMCRHVGSELMMLLETGENLQMGCLTEEAREMDMYLRALASHLSLTPSCHSRISSATYSYYDIF